MRLASRMLLRRRFSWYCRKISATEYNPKPDTYDNSGIYSLKCNACNLQYVGHTGRNFKARYLEHCRYIKSNDPKSAYALHVLNNEHEYESNQLHYDTNKVL